MGLGEYLDISFSNKPLIENNVGFKFLNIQSVWDLHRNIVGASSVHKAITNILQYKDIYLII